MLRFRLRDGQLLRKKLSASPPLTLIPSKRLGGPPLSAALKPLRKMLACAAVENICALPSVDHVALRSSAGVHPRLIRKSPKNNRRDFAHLGH